MLNDYYNDEDIDNHPRCMVCNDFATIKLFNHWYCHDCYADYKHELRKKLFKEKKNV